MKKALILSCLAASAISSGTANATAVCSGGSGASVAVSSTASGFIKVAFTARCSANVYTNYTETATALGVVAASLKGKNYFGGGTNGGGVRSLGACAATCGTTEVSDTNSATMSTAS